jgi:hypothetical protein
MQGIPNFLHGDTIVISRTPNGYAVQADKSSTVQESPCFETWAALIYYVEQNFVAQIPERGPDAPA